jgi:succinate-semialdehyde dehydrogenase/glutarate-semialdehyde dehydrogenase
MAQVTNSVSSSSSLTFESVNPATGERIATYELQSYEMVSAVAKKAKDTFRSKWRLTSIVEREQYLGSLAKVLRSKKARYAEIMTMEMGKPIAQAEAEVDKCAWAAEVYAENTGMWLENEFAATDSKESYVEYDPLGVILSIMPWNFPFWQAFRFAIPALAAGNVSILRHSNVCPGSALAIQEAFEDAGFPDGVFTTVITNHDVIADLIASDYISGISLTGSVGAGTRIAELSSTNLKKCVLELGGSDPFIVLEDADVEKSAKVGVEARLLNSGQSCICAKRFIVHKAVAKEFTERFVSEMAKKKVGDPMKKDTDVGPLANKDQVRTVDEQVRDTISKKGRVLLGGKPMPGAGAYYQLTVFDNLDMTMKVVKEEVFGPVAPILVVESEEEALRIANDSEFGLGASVWTNNLERGKRLAKVIESGMVFVNSLVKSDPRMPFGGIKKSGLGRELSKYGLKEFTNWKSVNVYGSSQEKQSGAKSE